MTRPPAPAPEKKTPLADRVICVIKLYYIKLLLTDSVINASDILINSIVFIGLFSNCPVCQTNPFG